MTPSTTERVNQKARTRWALIEACRRLLDSREEGYPSLEEVAEEALVSRATAYRYYPNMVDLICDVYFERATEGEEAVLGHADDPDDLGARLALVGDSINEFLFGDLFATHFAVKQGMDRWLEAGGDVSAGEVRPGRRIPMIDQALEPWRDRLEETAYDRLRAALTLTIGTEAAVALCDVAGLDAEQAKEVAAWAAQALVAATLDDAQT